MATLSGCKHVIALEHIDNVIELGFCPLEGCRMPFESVRYPDGDEVPQRDDDGMDDEEEEGEDEYDESFIDDEEDERPRRKHRKMASSDEESDDE